MRMLPPCDRELQAELRFSCALSTRNNRIEAFMDWLVRDDWEDTQTISEVDLSMSALVRCKIATQNRGYCTFPEVVWRDSLGPPVLRNVLSSGRLGFHATTCVTCHRFL